MLALEDINLNVAEREFVAILGPSGCGKSTLLNMVAGFDRPTRGTVRVDGEEIVDPSPRRGVVFQEPALFPWFSVMENVVFGPKTQRQPAADYRRRAAQILEQVGLRGFEASYPAELSGGMRQRVGIARVLIMQPQVLLMDEPFGSLDAQTRMLMQELLLQVWERHHQTVLFITHDIEEALLLADRVCVMTARPWPDQEEHRCADPPAARHRGDNVAGVQRAAPRGAGTHPRGKRASGDGPGEPLNEKARLHSSGWKCSTRNAGDCARSIQRVAANHNDCAVSCGRWSRHSGPYADQKYE